MRGEIRRLVVFISVIFVSAALVSWPRAAEPLAKSAPAADAPPAAATKNSKLKITVSKETTYVLGPLREDGSVDFAAALNELMSKGVTPENNAAVPFWQAMGPKEIPEEARPQFFKLLGIPPLPDKGDYLISFWDFGKQENRVKEPPAKGLELTPSEKSLMSQQDQASARPWSANEFPLVAKWLETIDKPLKLIVEASTRPRFFSPMCPRKRSDSIEQYWLIQPSRDAASALSIRAMLRLQSGEVDSAFQDALACHRLARLVCQNRLALDGFVGVTLDRIASEVDARIAEYGHISAAQSMNFQDQLRKLPAFEIGSMFGFGDRLFTLDGVCNAAAAGDLPGMIGHLTTSADDKFDARLGPLADLVAKRNLDMDGVLRRINQWYDRAAQSLSKPSYSERRDEFGSVLKDLESSSRPPVDSRAAAEKLSEAELSRWVADRLTNFCVGSLDKIPVNGSRQIARSGLARIAFAVASYRDENGGQYPAKLEDLVPKYATELPKDPFTDGQELHYRLRRNGYILYSVGPNGKDEGGREPEDRFPGDNIAIRVAHKPRDGR